MKTILYSILVVFLMVSCNNKSLVPDNIVNLEKEIKKSPSDKSFMELNDKYRELLNGKKLKGEDREKVLERAYKFFLDSGKDSYATTYLTELIKDFPNDKTSARIKDLIGIFDKKGNSELSKLMKNLYVKTYPDDADAKKSYGDQVDSVEIDFDRFLLNEGKKIFVDLEKTGKLNIKAAKNYVNDCEAFVLISPKDSLSPEYLFKAGEVAHTIKSYNKTFELYDWIIERYPDYKKTPTALFLKGYILDNELKKYDDAKEIYNEFLQKYPNSELVDDVQTLIEYMGKSDEEILKMIEAKKQEKRK